MNAPARFDLKTTPTPADLEIVVRDRRFLRGAEPRRWWLNGDPIATAWFNALSATFNSLVKVSTACCF